MREGCYNCHSQMIRPFRAETLRYGHYSVAGEFVYDHPFQWGSKRTGPDLHRVGGKYSDEWHRIHLNNPRDLVPESNMPAYPWLATRHGRPGRHGAADEGAAHGGRALHRRRDRQGAGEAVKGKTELDALIAYLQVLGTARQVSRGAIDMDVNDLRMRRHAWSRWSLFLGIVVWAWSRRNARQLRRGGAAALRRRRDAPSAARRTNDERLHQQRLVDLRRRRHPRRPGLACLWLLFVASKRKVMADDNTTGHVWDEDLRELNNPLPRWWMWLFVITVRVRAASTWCSIRAWAATPARWAGASVGQYEAEQAQGAARRWRRCTPSSPA